MQKYVLIFVANDLGEVLVLRKAKPEWQKGRINLVGGKVEPGEEFLDAAKREFREETGNDGSDFYYSGRITSDRSNFEIAVYGCHLDWYKPLVSEPDEPVSWESWTSVRDNPKLMDNLKVVLPLCLAGVRNWHYNHTFDSRGREIGGLAFDNPEADWVGVYHATATA